MSPNQNTVLFALPGDEKLGETLRSANNFEQGEYTLRNFPDGESYVRILSDIQGKNIVLVHSLHRPDSKFLPLYFFARTLKDLGSGNIHLISPYLPYMRQDKRFNPGEGITSTYFASLMSEVVDELTTIDPHLHRRESLAEIYRIPTHVGHAAPLIGQWIRDHVDKPVLIGPDSESKQWVAEVASMVDGPYLVMEKVRHGDRQVDITIPDHSDHLDRTPVLIDDIISSAGTMIKSVRVLLEANFTAPVCIGIHPIFAGDAYTQLLSTSENIRVVSCNTIHHPSNAIDITPLLTSKNLGN